MSIGDVQNAIWDNDTTKLGELMKKGLENNKQYGYPLGCVKFTFLIIMISM